LGVSHTRYRNLDWSHIAQLRTRPNQGNGARVTREWVFDIRLISIPMDRISSFRVRGVS